MKRAAYADMFGPTTGDKVRLADTDLIMRSKGLHRLRRGSEVRRRQGDPRWHGQSQVTNRQGAVDTVITNALILDHWAS